jgi:hypothetical protein
VERTSVPCVDCGGLLFFFYESMRSMRLGSPELSMKIIKSRCAANHDTTTLFDLHPSSLITSCTYYITTKGNICCNFSTCSMTAEISVGFLVRYGLYLHTHTSPPKILNPSLLSDIGGCKSFPFQMTFSRSFSTLC